MKDLNNPQPMEMEEGQEEEEMELVEQQELQEKKEKRDSTFIQDIGLDEEQEMGSDLHCSFQDPDYEEPRDIHLLSSSSEDECQLEESFMSRKGRRKKRKKGSVASGSSLTGVGQGGRQVRGARRGILRLECG